MRSFVLPGRFIALAASFALLSLLNPTLQSQAGDPAGATQFAPAAVAQPPSDAQPQKPPLAPLTPEQQGDLLMAGQRYQAAIEAFKKGDPASAALWNKMGVAHQLMFNQDEATRCYQRSLRLDPRQATVLNNLGTIYDSLKQYATAERAYRKALKIDPHSPLILKNLGTNLLTQHKYKKGWEAYQAGAGHRSWNLSAQRQSPH